MDEHAVSLLEFARVRGELEGLCASPEGAARLRDEPFLREAQALSDRLDLAVAFRELLESGRALPALDFPGLGTAAARLGKPGLQLEAEELACLGRWILSALKLRRCVTEQEARGASQGSRAGAAALRELAGGLPDLSALSRRIFAVVDRDGQLREKNIPALAAIRERMRRHREEADRAVRALVDDSAYRGYWQTAIPTLRDGRVVLPLKAQYKGRVKGIVHEVSASGSTVFIEPLEVVERNNAIVQEDMLYLAEVRRVLRELTAEASARAGDVRLMVARVAELDSIMARARYAIQHRCGRADTTPFRLSLREARHPLLGAGVVPVTVAAGGDARVLIITGPNTGGKTVTLKMVGLLAMMHQFGMEIPAGEGSGLPVFDAVHADIGDEQSIEQSLSTFSAHVKNLSRIVSMATPRSLVLLDELGAGTDPEEGVALAMALLDHLVATGCLVMVTTHHGILKNYGATRPGAQNASMGFDRESLEPTYRVLLGIPGESHAVEIARRSGMPETVLQSARAYLDDERTDISRLVANLAERHQALDAAEEEQRALERALREKSQSAAERETSVREKELELRRHGLRELRDFLDTARREWDGLRRGRGDRAAAEEFALLAEEVQSRIEREERRVAEEHEALVGDAPFEVREGLEVIIARSGRRGRVLRRDRGKRWVVETETLRLSLLPGELRPAPAAPAAAPVAVSFTPSSPIDAPVLELHIRGMRVDEALRLVERQVDSAIIHGLRQFSIVHGKGEGILRGAVHEYLRGLAAVGDFRFSLPEEGGFGKTVVTLKG